jgi:hypothetical protein
MINEYIGLHFEINMFGSLYQEKLLCLSTIYVLWKMHNLLFGQTYIGITNW